MLPRGDRAYSAREKWRFTHVPLLARLYRWKLWLQLELRFPLFRGNRFLAWAVRRLAERNLRDLVPDPRLRETLLPDYPIGGKRILISDDYYQTFARENVELVTSGIDHLTENAIVTRDGVAHAVDVVILATGFQSTAFLAPMTIEGLNGLSLADEWADGARAYRGMTIPGFPNFFMMYGPNTNLGHNSIIFMIESQTRYILGAIRTPRPAHCPCSFRGLPDPRPGSTRGAGRPTREAGQPPGALPRTVCRDDPADRVSTRNRA